MERSKVKISQTSIMHFVKFVFRSVVFILFAVLYVFNKVNNTGLLFGEYDKIIYLTLPVWLILLIEMFIRFFPNKLESPGCQKHLSKKFLPTKEKVPTKHSWKRTFIVAFLWLLGNGLIGLLYFLKIIDEGILVLLCLLYGIGDMICILFFCPFQTWFLKNRCCTDCRIYNWDFAFMFTPFIFIPHFFTWSLLGVSLILLVWWEIAIRLHPEWFSENTNAGLSCENCNERLCHHKKQLKEFIIKNKNRFFSKK